MPSVLSLFFICRVVFGNLAALSGSSSPSRLLRPLVLYHLSVDTLIIGHEQLSLKLSLPTRSVRAFSPVACFCLWVVFDNEFLRTWPNWGLFRRSLVHWSWTELRSYNFLPFVLLYNIHTSLIFQLSPALYSVICTFLFFFPVLFSFSAVTIMASPVFGHLIITYGSSVFQCP